jgi:hypothetical protein
MGSGSGSTEAGRFLRKLLRALDELRVGYYVYEEEDEVVVEVPLDDEHLPKKIYTPYWVGGRKWHYRIDYENSHDIDDWLLLLLERIAEKMGYESASDMPYFEPMDLKWYWKVPRNG